MNDEDGTPATPKEKPFFAIEQEPSEGSSEQTPLSGMVMGQVSSQSTPVAATQFGATQSSLGAAQLSGQVNTFAHGGQQFAQLQPQKVGFRWPQFLLGVIVPWVVIFSTTFLSAFLQDDYGDNWQDFYRYETYSMTPDSDGWFVQSVQTNGGEEIAWMDGCCFENNTTTAGVVVGNPWGDSAPGTQMIFETYQNESNGRYEERAIGNYTKANQTLWFKSSQFTAEQITVEIEVRDYEAEEEYYQSNQDFGETLFCLLPFVYIVGLIAAFVKGNNALGIGLLCAIPAAVIFFPLLFFLALLAFGF